MKFSEKLTKEQDRLEANQKELRQILHGVPLRTIQSWLHGEKTPPIYYQKLIIEYLSSKPSPK